MYCLSQCNFYFINAQSFSNSPPNYCWSDRICLWNTKNCYELCLLLCNRRRIQTFMGPIRSTWPWRKEEPHTASFCWTAMQWVSVQVVRAPPLPVSLCANDELQKWSVAARVENNLSAIFFFFSILQYQFHLRLFNGTYKYLWSRKPFHTAFPISRR